MVIIVAVVVTVVITALEWLTLVLSLLSVVGVGGGTFVGGVVVIVLVAVALVSALWDLFFRRELKVPQKISVPQRCNQARELRVHA